MGSTERHSCILLFRICQGIDWKDFCVDWDVKPHSLTHSLNPLAGSKCPDLYRQGDKSVAITCGETHARGKSGKPLASTAHCAVHLTPVDYVLKCDIVPSTVT